MKAPDADRLARLMSARFGLSIVAARIEIEGGVYQALRPAEPREPNGFSIVLATTPKMVEAHFRPDGFSGALLRAMADTDEGSRRAFVAQAKAAQEDGIDLALLFDGRLAGADNVLTGWQEIGVECTTRTVSAKHREDASTQLALAVATSCLALVLCLLSLEETDGGTGLVPELEGTRTTMLVNRYERSPANRAACLAHYGPTCAACGFSFLEAYGEIGDGFAEVHHRVPVSQLGASYAVDPIRDLVPLCSNCHAMIHRRTPPYSVSEISRMIKRKDEGAS